MTKRPDVKSSTDALFRDVDEKPARNRRSDYTGYKMTEAERAEKYGRAVTYRIPGELADAVKDAAKKHGYKISDFAEAIITAGLAEFEAGNVDIEGEKSK